MKVLAPKSRKTDRGKPRDGATKSARFITHSLNHKSRSELPPHRARPLQCCRGQFQSMKLIFSAPIQTEALKVKSFNRNDAASANFHRNYSINFRCPQYSLPCQFTKLVLNKAFWTKLLNKNPLKQITIEQHVIEQKASWTISQMNQLVLKNCLLKILLIEQNIYWTSHIWTIWQLSAMPTEHWRSENWSSTI